MLKEQDKQMIEMIYMNKGVSGLMELQMYNIIPNTIDITDLSIDEFTELFKDGYHVATAITLLGGI